MARTSNSVRRSQSAAYKRTPYQKTAYVNGTAVRHAEVGEGLERHLDQVSGRVPRRELEKQKQEMKRLRYRNAAYVLFLTVAFAGQQQRVAIARALASPAKVLLADEPTGNLDEEIADEIIKILMKSAHEMGKSVIVVTHSKKIADAADVVLKIHEGKLYHLV